MNRNNSPVKQKYFLDDKLHLSEKSNDDEKTCEDP